MLECDITGVNITRHVDTVISLYSIFKIYSMLKDKGIAPLKLTSKFNVHVNFDVISVPNIFFR
jgi:hypothetical protein